MFATAALAVLAAGCSKDTAKDMENPTAATRTIEVTAKYDVGDEQTAAAWTDHKGISWANDDFLWAGFTDGDKINNAVKSTGISIDEAGSATFTLDIAEGATMLRTYYPNPSGQPHVEPSFTQPLFRISATQTQPTAGAMTRMQDAAGFVGATVQNLSAASSYTVDLKAVSSVVRFIIYSSDPKYNTYSVESVSLEATEIAGLMGYVGYWSGNGDYITRDQRSNTITVALDTPYSLAGISSQADASGIYMGVMPTTTNGSTITVFTDKGRIVFESTKTKEYKSNTIHNVYLDLAKGKSLAAENKLVFSNGDPRDNYNFPKTGGDFNNGLTTVLTLDGVSILDEAKKAPAEKWAHYIEWVTGGEGWLDISFTPGTDYAWVVKTGKNMTAEARSAKVYLVYDGIQSTNYITFTQDAGPCVEVVPALTKVYETAIDKDGETVDVAARLALTVNGAASADVAADMQKYGVTLACGAAAAEVVNAQGDIKIVFPANSSSNEKHYTLKASFENHTSEVAFTQNAGEGGSIVEHTYSYTLFHNAADGSKGTGFGNVAGSVGDWYRLEGITIDGTTYTPGESLKALSESDLMKELIEYAFSFGEITPDDVQVPSADPLTTNPESFVTLEPWCDGGAAVYIRIVLTLNDSGARRTFKIITHDPDGSQSSSIVYFQNI